MAAAAKEGAGSGGNLIAADEATPDMLLAAGAYLFVCPENLGTMTGMMKEMFDRCYYPLLGRVEGRAYATVIAAGSDGAGAQAQPAYEPFGLFGAVEARGLITHPGGDTRPHVVGRGLDELRRIIREEEPPRPSTRLSTCDQSLDTIADRRRVDPRGLASTVRARWSCSKHIRNAFCV